MRNTIILLSPFLIITLVNESYKIKLSPLEVKKINLEEFKLDQCTWYCHDNGCQHSKKIDNVYVDKLYGAIIDFNYQGRDYKTYQLSNIVFLVILWPLFIYILLIKCIDIQQKIKEKTNDRIHL